MASNRILGILLVLLLLEIHPKLVNIYDSRSPMFATGGDTAILVSNTG